MGTKQMNIYSYTVDFGHVMGTQCVKEVVTAEHCTQNEWCCNHLTNRPFTMYITDKLYTPIFVQNSFIQYKVFKKIQYFSNLMSPKGSKPW
jgi:hypothetical protein